MTFVAYDVCRLWRLWPYYVCRPITFVALWPFSPYYVCRLWRLSPIMTFVANSDVCCQLLRLSLIGFVAVPRKSIVSQLFFYQELRGLGRPSGGGRRWVPAAVPRTGRSGLLIRDRGQHPTSLILILLPCHVQSRHEVGKPQRRIFLFYLLPYWTELLSTRMEWFSTFCDFWKATRFCWSGILKKSANFITRAHRTRGKVFIFRQLNYEYFCVKICRILPYTSKNNRQ